MFEPRAGLRRSLGVLPAALALLLAFCSTTESLVPFVTGASVASPLFRPVPPVLAVFLDFAGAVFAS